MSLSTGAPLLVRAGRWLLIAVFAAALVQSAHQAVFAQHSETDAKDTEAASKGPNAEQEHGASAAPQSKEKGPLFSLHNLFTLLMLVLLQAVLGFDNLLYISIESKRVAAEHRTYVRRMGIGLAIGLRIMLLFALMSALKYLQTTFFTFPDSMKSYITGSLNVHCLIVLGGGVFIMYTAMKEIYHMLSIEHLEEDTSGSQRSVASAVFWIVLMNLIFSFDSILSAMALTDVTLVMATAIVISGLMMMYLSDHVAEFLHRNRMYEVLGLFILFIVGVMLLSEGAHMSELHLFTHEVTAMSKSTFYFVLFVLVAIDIVQSRYQKKLIAMSKTGAH
ncbi:MAG: hypothetical protein KDB14_03140 [Planctomycetales bacterium]|nr:hypothetical protein [Planctomycetales bacterium]